MIGGCMDEEIKMLNEAAWERIKSGKSLTDEEIIEKVRRLEEKMLNGEYLREERSKVKAYRSKEGGANEENKSAARGGKLIRFAPRKASRPKADNLLHSYASAADEFFPCGL